MAYSHYNLWWYIKSHTGLVKAIPTKREVLRSGRSQGLLNLVKGIVNFSLKSAMDLSLLVELN